MKQSIYFLVFGLLLFSVVIEANLFPVVNGTTICSSKKPCLLKWTEDGTSPKLAELPNVQINLMTGPNDNQIKVMDLGTVPPLVGKTVYNISPNLGPPGRYYFYKFTAGTDEVWSGRFIIQDIQGTIPGFDPKTINAKGDVLGDPGNNNTTSSTDKPASASSVLSVNRVTAMGLSITAMAAVSYLC
ncbi:hypothetical protein C1645_817126 [Glomus cerebriforme]|uniref:Ser-Thr-rich glycosyl-phosphatidyl-inositol-anchored membrane family-domain-containing protein n=1 Tax=Glomus cerebriforme TaxID=658196 RepID=A0A397TA56_9GLOM|nr:hypothetical protein C1645_817126 [Glomus cerebriforme]